MQITVTIDLDEQLISDCANSAAKSLFRGPDSWGRSAVGYQIIASQVEAAVKSVDVTAIARETAERFAKGIVEDITRDTIKKMAKAVVKDEVTSGTLLPNGVK